MKPQLYIGILDMMDPEIDLRAKFAREMGSQIIVAVWLCDVPQTIAKAVSALELRFDADVIWVHRNSGRETNQAARDSARKAKIQVIDFDPETGPIEEDVHDLVSPNSSSNKGVGHGK